MKAIKINQTNKLKMSKLKRTVKVLYLRFLRNLSSERKVTRPKKMTESENKACEIFLTVLHDKDSKLYYDIKTQECYISSSDKTIFVFLESNNIKIINSVFGYDVHIKSNLENYLLEKFIREMGIRRNAFKKEVLSKINHSLDSTLIRMKSL